MRVFRLKYILLYTAFFCLFSCNFIFKENKPLNSASSIDTTGIIEEVSNFKKIKCDLKSGYKWSNLQRKCIRVFELGFRLTSIEKDSLGNGNNTYFFIDNDSLKAEIFMPDSEESIVMERDSEDENFKKGAIEFQTKNGSKNYSIKIDNKIAFVPAIPIDKNNLGKTEEQ